MMQKKSHILFMEIVNNVDKVRYVLCEFFQLKLRGNMI